MNAPVSRSILQRLRDHDYPTWRHSVRTGQLAGEIGKILGLSANACSMLRLAGMVHDLGKSKIPLTVLNRPGELTDDEWDEFIHPHPTWGAEMCEEAGYEPTVVRIVREHHERRRGTGYPHRLRLHQMHELTEIVAVADMYDAMTEWRSYRRAKTSLEAIGILRDEAGSHTIGADPVRALMTHLQIPL